MGTILIAGADQPTHQAIAAIVKGQPRIKQQDGNGDAHPRQNKGDEVDLSAIPKACALSVPSHWTQKNTKASGHLTILFGSMPFLFG